MIRPAYDTSTLCFFTILIFVIGDLYFAYNDHTCTTSWVVNAKVGFGLGTWLKVSGYTSFLFILFPIASFVLASCIPPLLIVYMTFAAMYAFFRLIWLVIGGIIYWGYLWGTGTCAPGLSLYMWINLIYGFFIVFALCYHQQNVYHGSSLLTRSRTIF